MIPDDSIFLSKMIVSISISCSASENKSFVLNVAAAYLSVSLSSELADSSTTCACLAFSVLFSIWAMGFEILYKDY